MQDVMWQVVLTGTLRAKQTQVRLQLLTIAASSKLAISKIMADYNFASIDITSSRAVRVVGDSQQVATPTGLVLKLK